VQDEYFNMAGHFREGAFEVCFKAPQFNHELIKETSNDHADARATTGTPAPYDVLAGARQQQDDLG
jgi:hypothetical protein